MPVGFPLPTRSGVLCSASIGSSPSPPFLSYSCSYREETQKTLIEDYRLKKRRKEGRGRSLTRSLTIGLTTPKVSMLPGARSPCSYPVWEDFTAKATKLHSQLRPNRKSPTSVSSLGRHVTPIERPGSHTDRDDMQMQAETHQRLIRGSLCSPRR
ncbi:hypothetical protein EYF80_031569 [Liparis tanakae]|uniref:Uncharacterized protein n=1 Tax=Liparis tanakae TaxID=230148 RepID=A0A4Z2GXM3_9TELE|nr:hypothetical protein EYF80_031569 [Liparis tanakae]